MIWIGEVAARLGLDRSNAIKWLKPACGRLGIPLRKGRHEAARGQMTYVWTEEEVERILEERRSRGFAVDSKAAEVPASDSSGCFYVLLLAPELSGRRIKVGFANDLTRRLAAHRCALPTARLLGAWPCETTDEAFMIRCAAACPSAERVGREVFDVDAQELLDRIEAAFGLAGVATLGT